MFRDGAHTPTAVISYSYEGGSPTRTAFGLVTDPRCSVRLVVRLDDGAVVQRIDYGPFGEVLYDSNPGFQPATEHACQWQASAGRQWRFASASRGYACGIYDADTGLVRFGARDYDAETGRWLSRDQQPSTPAGGRRAQGASGDLREQIAGFAAGDANLFAYVGGDPVNSVDPTGLCDTRPSFDFANYVLDAVCEGSPFLPVGGVPSVVAAVVCGVNTVQDFDASAEGARARFEAEMARSFQQLVEIGMIGQDDIDDFSSIVWSGHSDGLTGEQAVAQHANDCSRNPDRPGTDRWGVPCR